MTDITSHSINDLVQQHAYRTYEETEQFQDDVRRASNAVRGHDAAHVARKLLELGFERGFRARDVQVENLDQAYGELLTNISSVQETVGVYARIISAIQLRLAEDDAVNGIPLNVAADLDQIIFQGNMDLTEEF